MKPDHISLFVVFLILTTACTEPNYLNREVEGKEHFSIINESNQSRSFKLIINGKEFYNSTQAIIQDAFKFQKVIDRTEEIDSLKAIWLYTAHCTIHNTPISGLDWLHHPVLFYNSAGMGLCDDVANVNEAIWVNMGFPARTWYMDGHVVSEVFHAGKWKMYDSDLGIYLKNKDSILSVQNIAAIPGVILQNRNRVEITQRTETFDEDFWKYVAMIYMKHESHEIEDWYPASDSLEYDYTISLPPGAELIFGKALTKFPVHLEFPAPNYYNLILRSHYIDYLKLDLFLIPLQINGTGKIRLDGTEYQIENLTDSLLYVRDNPIKSIEIIDGRDIEISYMVNGHIFGLDNPKSEIRIEGKDLEGLRLQGKD